MNNKLKLASIFALIVSLSISNGTLAQSQNPHAPQQFKSKITRTTEIFILELLDFYSDGNIDTDSKNKIEALAFELLEAERMVHPAPTNNYVKQTFREGSEQARLDKRIREIPNEIEGLLNGVGNAEAQGVLKKRLEVLKGRINK